jgi:lysophospholipase L1-like esterase
MHERFLALGDSYTIGESVPAGERWPVRLADMLRAEGLPVAEPEIVATTGWTTDELGAAIDRAGVAEYTQQFAGLLARAIHLAGGVPGRVLVLAIPDWGVTPFAAGRDGAAIGADLDAFNAANRAAAQAAGAHYVDVAPVSRLAGIDPGLLAADGLHPSGRLYHEWARLALPAARLALST